MTISAGGSASPAATRAVTTYAYEPSSRVDELELGFAGTADDLTSAFDYNPAGQNARDRGADRPLR